MGRRHSGPSGRVPRAREHRAASACKLVLGRAIDNARIPAHAIAQTAGSVLSSAGSCDVWPVLCAARRAATAASRTVSAVRDFAEIITATSVGRTPRTKVDRAIQVQRGNTPSTTRQSWIVRSERVGRRAASRHRRTRRRASHSEKWSCPAIAVVPRAPCGGL